VAMSALRVRLIRARDFLPPSRSVVFWTNRFHVK
jgi:hypothetical protein